MSQSKKKNVIECSEQTCLEIFFIHKNVRFVRKHFFKIQKYIGRIRLMRRSGNKALYYR